MVYLFLHSLILEQRPVAVVVVVVVAGVTPVVVVTLVVDWMIPFSHLTLLAVCLYDSIWVHILVYAPGSKT